MSYLVLLSRHGTTSVCNDSLRKPSNKPHNAELKLLEPHLFTETDEGGEFLSARLSFVNHKKYIMIYGRCSGISGKKNFW